MAQRTEISTYQEALAELKRALTFGIRPSLEGVTRLVEELGRPDSTFVSIQVTGTNGKTSTTRLIDALLRASGMISGLYTSPELIDYTERVVIDGAPIAPDLFARCLQRVVDARDALAQRGEVLGAQVTEFELLTALALVAFKETQRDFAVLEVGLGGRWDATSVVSPAVSVITGVGLDHTAILGDTIEEIAADKAMIIKPGSTPVIGAGLGSALDVVLARCTELDAHPRVVCRADEPSPVIEERTARVYIERTTPDTNTLLTTEATVVTPHARYQSLRVPGPAYQALNCATALCAAESALGRALSPDAVRAALHDGTFPGRLELIRRDPLLIFDGGHNPQAAELLRSNLELAQVRPIIALGVFADKDYERIIEALAPVAADFIAFDRGLERSLPAGELASAIERMTGKSARAILPRATLASLEKASGGEPLVIAGSLSNYVLLES